MDRDAVLAAALGTAVLAGCTRSPSPPPAPSESPSPPPVDPDVAALTGWLTAENAIAARYAAAAKRSPALAALRANHLARAAAVTDHLRVRGVTPSAAPARSPLRGALPSVVKALGEAERSLATRYVLGIGAIRDPKVAVLAAELAAGARQHATVLELL